MINFNLLLAGKKKLSNDKFIGDDKNPHVRLFASLPGLSKPLKKYVQGHSLAEHQLDLSASVFNGLPGLWFEDTESTGRVFGAESYLNMVDPEESKFVDMSA